MMQIQLNSRASLTSVRGLLNTVCETSSGAATDQL